MSIVKIEKEKALKTESLLYAIIILLLQMRQLLQVLLSKHQHQLC